MDLDSFVTLNDAQIRESESQASIADKLADIPDKLAHADLTEQQAINQHLKNVSLSLNIQWDDQAHSQLLAARNQALRRARCLRDQSALLASKSRDAGWLLNGSGSLTAVQAGWIGFEYLRRNMPLSAVAKTSNVIPPVEAFDANAWRHPLHDTPQAEPRHDGWSLLFWARTHNLFPVGGSPAARYIADIFAAMADAVAAEAAEIDKRTAVAEASAIELEKLDWSRLQHPAGLGAATQ